MAQLSRRPTISPNTRPVTSNGHNALLTGSDRPSYSAGFVATGALPDFPLFRQLSAALRHAAAGIPAWQPLQVARRSRAPLDRYEKQHPTRPQEGAAPSRVKLTTVAVKILPELETGTLRTFS